MRKNIVYKLKLVQESINERLKFLIGALKLSARAFSAQLQVPESNTRNYLDKQTKLNSDYLERISLHFKSVNLTWLITGHGEPFLQSQNENNPIPPNEQKFFRSQVVGENKGTASQQQNIASVQDEALVNKLALAEKDIESLRAQLAIKDALLAAKEETITLLRGSYNRPN